MESPFGSAVSALSRRSFHKSQRPPLATGFPPLNTRAPADVHNFRSTHYRFSEIGTPLGTLYRPRGGGNCRISRRFDISNYALMAARFANELRRLIGPGSIHPDFGPPEQRRHSSTSGCGPNQTVTCVCFGTNDLRLRVADSSGRMVVSGRCASSVSRQMSGRILRRLHATPCRQR